MNKHPHRRPDGIDAIPSHATGHPVRRALAASGAGPDAAPQPCVARLRASRPWLATEIAA